MHPNTHALATAIATTIRHCGGWELRRSTGRQACMQCSGSLRITALCRAGHSLAGWTMSRASIATTVACRRQASSLYAFSAHAHSCLPLRRLGLPAERASREWPPAARVTAAAAAVPEGASHDATPAANTHSEDRARRIELRLATTVAAAARAASRGVRRNSCLADHRGHGRRCHCGGSSAADVVAPGHLQRCPHPHLKRGAGTVTVA